jgi:hypothetical protein
LYEIYSDVRYNGLFRQIANIEIKLKEAIDYAIKLAGTATQKGLVGELMDDFRTLNMSEAIDETIKKVDDSISLYFGILKILQYWEDYQDVVRTARQIKETQEENIKQLKGK